MQQLVHPLNRPQLDVNASARRALNAGLRELREKILLVHLVLIHSLPKLFSKESGSSGIWD